MARSYKERVYEILEATDPEDRVAKAVNLVMLILVVSNVIAVVWRRWIAFISRTGIFSITSQAYQ